MQDTVKEAEIVHRESLESSRLILGGDNPDTSTSRSNTASNPKAQGKLEEAEIILDARRRIIRPRHHQASQEQHSWVSVRARQARGSQALNGETEKKTRFS